MTAVVVLSGPVSSLNKMGIFKRHISRALIISAVVCFVYIPWVSPLSPFRLPGLKIIDSFYLINNALRPLEAAAKNVVIISIDDESFKKMNMRWPWPRGTTADMLEKIRADKPAVVCLDIVFFGESVSAVDDLRLARAIKDSGNVIIGAYFGAGGKYVLPDRTIAESAKEVGFVNKPRDIDNVIRRMRPVLFSTSGNIIDYSLAAKTAAYLLGQPVDKTVSKAPLLKNDTAYLYYFGNMDKFVPIPAWKVLKNETARGAFKGKAVFVGSTSEILHDNHPTPLGIMPGVVMGVNETLAFLTGKYLRQGGRVLNYTILFIFVFIAVWSSLSLPFIRGIAVNAAGITAFLCLSLILFLKGIVIDPFGGIFLITAVSVIMYGKRHIVLAFENIELQKEATTDGLTGLYVYRYFELRLKMDLENAAREKKPIVLIIYDIDRFKQINDVYGHEFGNTVLKAVAKTIKDNTRRHDTVARYGGDEFCVLMLEATREDAKRHAKRVLDSIKQMSFETADDKKTAVKITLSIGIVSSENYTPNTPADFVKAADSALYRSKNEGRDRASVFSTD